MWLGLLLIPLVLVCFGLSPMAWAVSPTPDGAYPNSNCAEGGISALFSLTTGHDNVALGVQAMEFNTIGSMNTATGFAALFDNISGLSNTATGDEALLNNTIANNNTADGAFALFSNTTGGENAATGFAALFSNTIGSANTASGSQALISNTTGLSNTAAGFQALLNNTVANDNTADGAYALFSNTFGEQNTATGLGALFANTDGFDNVANGFFALSSNIHGAFNTADGAGALISCTGGGNTAVGFLAGPNLTTGTNNTYIGAGSGGPGNESGWIRIGPTGALVGGTNSHTAIGGIFGATVGAVNSPVLVNASGQLGTAVSSARFKKDIDSMGKSSEAIFSLRPVTFHYKGDETNLPCFGLIAEEVAKVNPDLILKDKEGKPFTVRYEQINAMLLNEFLKEHKKVEEQQASIAELKNEVQTAVAQLKEQAAQIQKVSAQVEMSKPAPQMVNNNQ